MINEQESTATVHTEASNTLQCILMCNSSENNQYNRMGFFAVFALLVASAAAGSQTPYSFSSPVGFSYGATYVTSGEGRITGIRVWFANNIRGIQFRHGNIWSPVTANPYGSLQEMKLFDGEAIIQISGKYTYNIMFLVFVTNRGRSLYVGNPVGHSFNIYPENSQAELVFISGRVHYGLRSLGAHWAVINPSSNSSARH